MKSEIIKEQAEKQKINWDKVNILKCNDGDIYMSTGHHCEGDFKAIVIYLSPTNPCSGNFVGNILPRVTKSAFELITEPIQIEFKNEL